MMTLTSRGGSMPIGMASIRMAGSVGAFVKSLTRVQRAGRAPRRSIGPGEGDLVERFRPDLLGGARDHAPAEGAIEFGGRLVVGERPNHHALQPALSEVALGGGEQAAAKTEPLEFRPQIELVNLALEMQAACTVTAVISIARDLVAQHQH